MNNRYPALVVLLAVSVIGIAQTAPLNQPKQNQPHAQQDPAKPATQTPPDTSAPEAKAPTTTDKTAGTSSAKPADKAAAYYHFSMAHIYEEMVTMYGRTEYADKAIEEYRLAIAADPGSEYLNAGLAELYAKTGRIRDAVVEAQDIIKRDPNNVDARKLLGRIYLRSLGDTQSPDTHSNDILHRAIEQYEAIVKLEPTDVDDHLLLGRLYRLNNDSPKAEAEFKEAVKLDPDNEDAVTTLAYLYNEQGESAKATQLLSSVPNSDRTGKLYSALGYTYEQQKDYKKAIDAYRKAVENDKDNLDAMRGLAQNLMNDGQTDAALEQFKLIVDADPQDPQSYMRMAEIYRRQGKYDDALAMLKKASAYVQDSLEVPYNMAVIYQAQGKYDDAITILQGLVQKTDKPDGNYGPGDRNNRGIFLERLGNIYREQNHTDQAVEIFRKMVAMGGEDNVSRGYQEIIETYRDGKQWNDALATAKEASTKLPNDRSLKLTLASQLADMGQPDAGVNLAQSLLKGNGSAEDRDVYIAVAQMDTRLKRWKDAEENITKAEQLATKPEDKAYVCFVYGSVYERQKKFEPAEQMFKRALANDPNSGMTLNYLGYMLADRGTRLDEALGYLKKAVQLEPQNGAYLDSIGWAYFKLGNYEAAEDNLTRAAEHIGDDPTVQDHLGELYAKMGRLRVAAAHWERALNEWNKSLAADADPTDVARVQKKLEQTKVRLARDSKADATKP
jgi:tetratricopeptide (TPR) repeat protein